MAQPRRIALMLEVHVLYKQHVDVFAGVQRYADEQGWDTYIDDYCDLALEEAKPGAVPYDGVIARVNATSLSLVDSARRFGLPLVNVMRGSTVADRLPGVFPDFEELGRLRAEHLLSRGLRRFACFDVEGVVPYALQAEGFMSTIERAGYEVSRLTIPQSALSIEGYPAVVTDIDRWMDTWQPPIGLATDTDVFARLFVQKSRLRGWHVPGDVAVVGGMNEEKLCEQPRPSMTSVEVGYERVGYEAARMLDRLMQEKERAKDAKQQKKPAVPKPARSQHVLLPPIGVVVRESTDFYAVDDAMVARAMRYIADQCHMHLSVVDVAGAVGVSTTTLQGRFRKTLGRSVADEIRRVRIEKAKRELVDTDEPIEAIAVRAGFASRMRLYEVFRRELGVSPGGYRKQRRIEAEAGDNPLSDETSKTL